MKKLILLFCLIANFAFGQTGPVTPTWRAPLTQAGHDLLMYNYAGKIGGPDSLYSKYYLDQHFAPIADGVIKGLVTTLSGSNAVTSAGTWIIAGTVYTTTSPATTALDAQDATLSRYDLITATNTGTITKVSGVLSANPEVPDVPAGSIAISQFLITPTSVTNSPVVTGFVPYTGWKGPVNGNGYQLTVGSLVISNTAGTGYVNLKNQTAIPAKPVSGIDIFYKNNFGWIRTNGFTTTINDAGLTASRSYTVPDLSDTLVNAARLRTYQVYVGANYVPQTRTIDINGGSPQALTGNVHLTVSAGSAYTGSNGIVLTALNFTADTTGGSGIALATKPYVNNFLTQVSAKALYFKSLIPTAVKTANYTASPQDYIPVNTTSGSVTITLPNTPAIKQ